MSVHKEFGVYREETLGSLGHEYGSGRRSEEFLSPSTCIILQRIILTCGVVILVFVGIQTFN